MIIVNTSYHLHPTAVPMFRQWLKTNFMPLAQGVHPRVMRILASTGDEVEAWAVQTEHHDVEEAQCWEDEVAANTRVALQPYVGKNLVYFTTMMEVVTEI